MFSVIPSSLAPRFEKLLLMLSSPQAGEVVNAAGAITQTLKSVDCDWHDLVAGLLAKPQTRALPDDSSNDWWLMRELCIEHQYLLRPREIEFVTSLGRWRGDLTEKQFDWLLAIYARVQRAAA
jgi:hypothetical protein